MPRSSVAQSVKLKPADPFDLIRWLARSQSERPSSDRLPPAELRGMLLQSGVTIDVIDGLARGAAQRRFAVVPRRFTGERLALPEEVPVPGRVGRGDCWPS